MKQPKKPTLNQKKLIRAAGLDCKDWNVGNEDNLSFTIINKQTKERKVILK